MKIGDVQIKPGHPVLVGVVADRLWEKAAWNSADILEIRLDRLWSLPGNEGIPPEIEESGKFICGVKEKLKKPVILTIRRPEENEAPFPENLPDEKRLPFFQSLIPAADAVDIEVDSVIAQKVIRMAARAKKPVIGSYHNFRHLPPDKTLCEKLGKAKNLGADIFKVAALTETPKEMVRFLSFCQLFSSRHLICAVAMGKRSFLFRVAAPLFGSVLTYASLTGATAPGQPDVETLASLLRQFYS